MIRFPDDRGLLSGPGDAFLDIPEHLRPAFAPAEHLLYEWSTYYVDYPGADRLLVGQIWYEPITPGLFAIIFKNQLGLTRIQPFNGTQWLCPGLHVEVISRKFSRAEQHLALLERLIGDLFAQAAQLPFTFQAPTARMVIEAIQPPTPLFTYHFLCQYAPSLTTALRTIQAQPHRILHEAELHVSLAEATVVDSDVLIDILQAPEQWVPTRSSMALARRLRNSAPTHIWQRRPEESFDTPENRFVLAFLHELSHASERLSAQPWWNRISPERQIMIRELVGRLRVAERHTPFDQVGALRMIPQAWMAVRS